MQVPLEAEASTSKSFLTDEWEGGGGGGGGRGQPEEQYKGK